MFKVRRTQALHPRRQLATTLDANLPNDAQSPFDPIRFPWRRLIVFVVVASAVYGGFLTAWPSVGSVYGATYRAYARALLADFGGDKVEFRRSVKQPNMDTEIIANRRRVPVAGRCYHSTRVIGYLTTAEFVALVLATPVPWKRRLRALFVGLCAVHVYIVLRLIVVLVWLYSTPDAPFAKYDLGTTGRYVTTWLCATIASSLNGTFFGPVAIWLAVMLRKNEMMIFLRRQTTAGGPEV